MTLSKLGIDTRRFIGLFALIAAGSLYFVFRPIPQLVEGEIISGREVNYVYKHEPLIGAKVYFLTEKQARHMENVFHSWRTDTAEKLQREYKSLFETFGIQNNGQYTIPGENKEAIERANKMADIIKQFDYNPERIFPAIPSKDDVFAFLHGFDPTILDQSLRTVSDLNGKFSLTLTKGRRYWVYCTSDHEYTSNIFAIPSTGDPYDLTNMITSIWFFPFYANPGKLVLSSENKVR